MSHCKEDPSSGGLGRYSPRPGVTIADGEDIPWISGREALATMTPEFRNGLGDVDRVDELMSRYWVRSLWLDPVTTRRIDHVRVDSGYQDLSEAYHDSVEESLVLRGSVTLSAEGALQEGDYFWR